MAKGLEDEDEEVAGVAHAISGLKLRKWTVFGALMWFWGSSAIWKWSKIDSKWTVFGALTFFWGSFTVWKWTTLGALTRL